MTPPSASAPDEAPPRTRQPKSELDRQVKLTRQIESRWRQLNRSFKEGVTQAFVDELADNQEAPSG